MDLREESRGHRADDLGWSDAGITEDGQNKLVPFLSFKLKNNSDQKLSVLQVNAMFQPLKEDKEWGIAVPVGHRLRGTRARRDDAGHHADVRSRRQSAPDPRGTIMKSLAFRRRARAG